MSNNNDFSTPEKALISFIVAVVSGLAGKVLSDKEHKGVYKKQDEAALKIKEQLEEVKRGDFKNVSVYKLTQSTDLYNSSIGKDSTLAKDELVLVIDDNEDFYKVVRVNSEETGYLNRKFCKDWIKINSVEDVQYKKRKVENDKNIIVLLQDVDLYNSSKGKDPVMEKGELVKIVSYGNDFYKVLRLKTGETGYVNRRFVD